MQHQQLKEEVANVQPDHIVAANKALLAAIKENSLDKVTLAITSELNLNAHVLEITFLQYAILTKASTAIMELLIQKGAEIDGPDEKNLYTPFHYAVMTRNIEAIQFLHSKKINIDKRNKHQKTALHLACLIGNYDNKPVNVYKEYDLPSQSFHINAEVINLVIQLGADINSTEDQGNTPLHFLVRHNYADGVKILLAKGADAHAKNADGESALHTTARLNLNDTVIAELLLEKDNTLLTDRLNNSYTPLHTACYYVNLQLVKLLLKKGANVTEKLKDGNTALHLDYANKARKKEIKEIIQLLIDSGADINAVNNIGETPLHLAVLRMYGAEMVKLFADNKADMNARTLKGLTPLYYAVDSARMNKINFFVKDLKVSVDEMLANEKKIIPNGIPEKFVEQFNEIDCLYLHTAKALLDCGANIQNEPIGVDKFGQKGNFLQLLTKVDSSLVNKPLNYFLKNKFNTVNIQSKETMNTDKTNYKKYIAEMEPRTDIHFKDVDGFTRLHTAVKLGKKNSLQRLLSLAAEVNTKNNIGDTPLHDAVEKGDKEIVALLIEHGADLGAKNNVNDTPFHVAINKDTDINTDDTDIIKLLVAKGADIKLPDGDGFPCIAAATYKNHPNKVKLLIKLKADINATTVGDNQTAMHIAAANVFLEIVEILLAKKAHFDMKDKNNITPLLHVFNDIVSPHQFAIVKLLVNAGADITVRDHEGNTALHLAVNPSRIAEVTDNNNVTGNGIVYEIVKFLIDHNAQINAKNKSKQTPLHLACLRCNNTEILKLLIKNGANVNATTKEEGATPLIVAATTSDNLAVVKLLIDNDANIEVKDNFGATALHKAVNLRKNEKVVAYLLEKGAAVNVKIDKMITPLHHVLQSSVNEKKEILKSHFKNKTIEEILNTENLEPFKESFKQIDQDYLAIATTLISYGADLNLEFREKTKNGILIFNLNPRLNNKLILDYIKAQQEKAKENKKEEKGVVENVKTSEEIEKEKEIARKKEQKKLEQQELQKKQAEEKARLAAKPIYETIAEMFVNTTIGFTYDETKKSYTFKFKTHDSYQAFKTIFKNHQLLKNTKLQFNGLIISFTEDEINLKKAFKEDNNFIIKLKEIIEKNSIQKDELPKSRTQAEGEAEWDIAFKAHWQTYLKSIFPFDIKVETNKDNLVLEVTLNQFNEKTKMLSTILNKFFDVDTGTGEATVILKDNKIIIKPLNKSSYNSYKDIAQPTFEKTSDLKALINKELNSNNNPTLFTTSQILEKTNTTQTQKTASKKATSDNNNVNANTTVEPPKEEDKEAFKAKIKAFMNYISGNILSDKLNYFKITRINQNLSRIEMQFDVKAYSSFATNTTPTGSMQLLTKMKQAVNKVLGHDVMTLDEKENSIKFFFSKVDKAELFKKQEEISKVFNELNTEVENEVKISDGKQEIKTDNNNAKTVDNNADAVFTVNNLFNEIHQILTRIKNNPEKSKNLLALLNVLNNYSPTKNASDDVIFFHAYKLLATYTMNALSQEHYANENNLPHMYNLRSITRHAYDVYEWQDFHQLFSPFFKKLEEICIQIFNSTTDAAPTLYKQKNALLPHVTSLNDELNLFAPLLTEGLLKGNSLIADINSFEAQIASLKADFNHNDLSEKTIKTIHFAILQFCCQIGEGSDKSKKLEKEIYGELHKPNLKNNPFEILNKLFQRYLFPVSENMEVNAKVGRGK